MVLILSRNWSLLNKYFFLVWLAFLASQITGYSQRKANCELSIYGSLKVDVCGNEKAKQFILVMSIGNVQRSDSLFGYNYEITFDNNKVKITDALYFNTLSEFMDAKSASINNSLGKINGYAITFGTEPIYGNKPLAAFNGVWISECPDTAFFKINYIEFTDEFKVGIDTLKPAVLLGIVDTINGRIFSISVNNEEINITEDTFYIDCSLNVPDNSRIDYFDIVAKYNPEYYQLDSVIIPDSIIEYLIVDNELDGSIFKFKLLSDINANLNLKIRGRLKLFNTFSDKIILYPNFDKYCKCVVGSSIDSVNVKYNNISLVSELTDNIYSRDGDCMYRVYDVMGRLIFESETEEENFYVVPSGFYFIVKNCSGKIILKKTINVNY